MIKYEILGLLGWKPLTGYDLKLIFRDSLIMSRTGSNNQIYRTLVKLHEEGLVTREIEDPESGPSRKIYTITPAGEQTLRTWLLEQPDLPELKNTFLTRVAWADRLSDDELDAMLATYEEEVNYRWIMQHEFMERESHNQPDRTAREQLLWESIHKNWIAFYERELTWVKTLRADLKTLSTRKRDSRQPEPRPYKFNV